MTYTPEWVAKPEVARRHLVVAIRMFFSEADPVVIHSVVAAAHQVLSDLAVPTGVTGLIRQAVLQDLDIETVRTALRLHDIIGDEAAET